MPDTPMRRVFTAGLGIVTLLVVPGTNAQYRSPDDPGILLESTTLDRMPARRNDAPYRPAARPPSRSTHSVPLSGNARQLVVHGTFNDRLSGPMLVDTGASYCVVTRSAAERLGLKAGDAGSVPVTTANGQVAAGLVELDSVQIEDARLASVQALILDAVEPPLVGVIGLSFLNHFRYSVDHARGMIQLER